MSSIGWCERRPGPSPRPLPFILPFIHVCHEACRNHPITVSTTGWKAIKIHIITYYHNDNFYLNILFYIKYKYITIISLTLLSWWLLTTRGNWGWSVIGWCERCAATSPMSFAHVCHFHYKIESHDKSYYHNYNNCF